MKLIQITNDEILKGFREPSAYYDLKENRELHEKLIACDLTVDNEGDICGIVDGERYWITTEPEIFRFNKACDYSVNLKYKVHKSSKHNDTVLELHW